MLLLVKRSFPLNSKFDNLNIWKKERCNVCNVLAVLGWNTKYILFHGLVVHSLPPTLGKLKLAQL